VPARLTGFPGAVRLVRQCRAAGLKTALASSADPIKIHANLDQIDLPWAEWDAVVSGEDVAHKKPAPDLFLRAAAKLGLSSGQCVVVEDAVNGVQAAQAAGMRCVAVAHTFAASQLRGAEEVCDTIADVTIARLLGPP
jgi:HAD superfamily hydrolase (TIGR01509 family)